MKHTLLVAFLFVFTVMGVCPSGKYLFEIPQGWPQPEYDFSQNVLSEEKIMLGRVLFYDPILSRDSSISCASCHSSYSAFTHVDHDVSHGIGDQMGTRNAPALMNLAWQKDFMWDGAIKHLDLQALGPITHPKEMDENLVHVLSKLQHKKQYPTLFEQAFGDSSITGEHMLKSISQFMLTLVSANSKYDQMIRKEIAFTEQEQNGYRLFQKNCSSCHAEPLFTNAEFRNNGLPPDSEFKDIGRMLITGNVQDSLLFKVPTLRNIEYTYPYMHDGRFRKLSQVIEHYMSGVKPSKSLSEELKNKVLLDEHEKVDLLAFLLTLSDKNFVHNPSFQYPYKLFTGTPKD